LVIAICEKLGGSNEKLHSSSCSGVPNCEKWGGRLPV
jgi:hypothetical protein